MVSQWGGVVGRVRPRLLYFCFSIFMVGPYFWHLWPSLADSEAAVEHGIVVVGVDNGIAAELVNAAVEG